MLFFTSPTISHHPLPTLYHYRSAAVPQTQLSEVKSCRPGDLLWRLAQTVCLLARCRSSSLLCRVWERFVQQLRAHWETVRIVPGSVTGTAAVTVTVGTACCNRYRRCSCSGIPATVGAVATADTGDTVETVQKISPNPHSQSVLSPSGHSLSTFSYLDLFQSKNRYKVSQSLVLNVQHWILVITKYAMNVTIILQCWLCE